MPSSAQNPDPEETGLSSFFKTFSNYLTHPFSIFSNLQHLMGRDLVSLELINWHSFHRNEKLEAMASFHNFKRCHKEECDFLDISINVGLDKDEKELSLEGCFLKIRKSLSKGIIIIQHGNTGFYQGDTQEAKEFLERGYDVLLYNRRACMGSKGDASADDIVNDCPIVVSKVRELLRNFYKLNEGCTDEELNKSIIIYGHSMGGLIAGNASSQPGMENIRYIFHCMGAHLRKGVRSLSRAISDSERDFLDYLLHRLMGDYFENIKNIKLIKEDNRLIIIKSEESWKKHENSTEDSLDESFHKFEDILDAEKMHSDIIPGHIEHFLELIKVEEELEYCKERIKEALLSCIEKSLKDSQENEGQDLDKGLLLEGIFKSIFRVIHHLIREGEVEATDFKISYSLPKEISNPSNLQSVIDLKELMEETSFQDFRILVLKLKSLKEYKRNLLSDGDSFLNQADHLDRNNPSMSRDAFDFIGQKLEEKSRALAHLCLKDSDILKNAEASHKARCLRELKKRRHLFSGKEKKHAQTNTLSS